MEKFVEAMAKRSGQDTLCLLQQEEAIRRQVFDEMAADADRLLGQEGPFLQPGDEGNGEVRDNNEG